MAGAFVGGFIGSAFGFGSVTGFDIRSLLLAIGGSILLLIIYRVVKR
ncbi:MAG: GlsB/YeaQ/YmgE family stress response membrane protein [Desulfobacterales bacterium]